MIFLKIKLLTVSLATGVLVMTSKKTHLVAQLPRISWTPFSVPSKVLHACNYAWKLLNVNLFMKVF